MPRIKTIALTTDQFKNHIKNAPPLNPWVYYSPKYDNYAYSFDEKKEIHIMGVSCLFYSQGSKLSSTYIKICRLSSNDFKI